MLLHFNWWYILAPAGIIGMVVFSLMRAINQTKHSRHLWQVGQKCLVVIFGITFGILLILESWRGIVSFWDVDPESSIFYAYCLAVISIIAVAFVYGVVLDVIAYHCFRYRKHVRKLWRRLKRVPQNEQPQQPSQPKSDAEKLAEARQMMVELFGCRFESELLTAKKVVQTTQELLNQQELQEVISIAKLEPELTTPQTVEELSAGRSNQPVPIAEALNTFSGEDIARVKAYLQINNQFFANARNNIAVFVAMEGEGDKRHARCTAKSVVV